MPHPRLRLLVCLLVMLPLLAAGLQAAADPLAGRIPPAKPQAQAKMPQKTCCAAMAAMAGMPDGCACPAGSPCQVSTDPKLPAPEAELLSPARAQAPAPAAGPVVMVLALARPADLAADLLPDPPPSERYLALNNLRI